MVTIAILGLGARGGNIYAECLKNNKKAKVVAVCDINKEKVAKLKAFFDLTDDQCFFDQDELLKEKRADGIIIAHDDDDHYDSAIKALDLGYDILIEKPISPNPLECLEIADKAIKLNKKVIVAHVLRYAPFYDTIKKIITSKKIGDIIDLSQTENVGFWHYAHSFVRGNWNNSNTSSPMILAKCCHDLDMINYLLDKECLSLSSIGNLKFFTKENKPQGATHRCTDGCPHLSTCAYNAIKVYIDNAVDNNNGWLSQYISVDQSKESILNGLKTGPYGICVWDCDNNVVDHQTVLMQYEDGITATLNMNIFSKDCFRELRIAGTEGEIIANDRDNIIKVNCWNGETQTIDINELYPKMIGHGNGDVVLTDRFVDMLARENAHVENIDQSISSHINAFAAEKSRLLDGQRIVIDDFVKEIFNKNDK